MELPVVGDLQWQGYRNGESLDRPGFDRIPPDFKHKLPDKLLWTHGWCNQPWIYEKMSSRGPELLSTVVEDGNRTAREIRHKAQGEEVEEDEGVQSSIVNSRHRKQKLQEDIALVASLKACAKQKDLFKGSRIHAELLKRGLLKNNTYVGTAVVSMYAKCGALVKAQEVFDNLPDHNVVTWTALLAGYAQHGQGEAAMNCFEQMQQEGLSPNAATFACVLKACGSMRMAKKGSEIHDEIARNGLLNKDVVLGNALVDMYAKCGALRKAQEVFDELPARDIISWTSLIAGYVQHGQGREALNCFEQLKCEGLSADAVTFACVLKACASIGAAEEGKKIHDEILRQGLLDKGLLLGHALVDMYAKCGVLRKARQVFDKLSVRTVGTWTTLIAGYAQHGEGGEALRCFEQMQCEGLTPDAVTYTCVLKACGSIGAAEKGTTIHAEIAKRGLLEKHLVLGNALVDMYAKCGALAKAQQVFDNLPVWDVVSWTALITGYAQNGHGEEALTCFEKMQREGFHPDAVTLVCILRACGIVGAVEKGHEIHAKIVRDGLLEKDVVLGNALVDMYAKCGALARAKQVFDELPVRDVVTWNVMIAGYAQQGRGEDALNCFEQMHNEGLSPDPVTFICILKACGAIGATEKGKEIHLQIVKEGLLENSLVLGALVDMYAKCGALPKAQEVFDKLPTRNLVTWTALIAGYAQQRRGKEALNCFEWMQSEGVSPNAVTFLVVLYACCHSGLVDEGQKYFTTMSTDYGIIPTIEHLTCMIDLYVRAGHFDKALAMVKEMPSSQLVVWSALLSACRKWGNVKLGRLAFEQAVQLDEKFSAAYVCMSNIYATAGMQDDAYKIDAMRLQREAWKEDGRSQDAVGGPMCSPTLDQV